MTLFVLTQRNIAMPKYRFEAVDQKGKKYSGNVDAADESTAQGMLREKGLFPTSVIPADGEAGGKASGKR